MPRRKLDNVRMHLLLTRKQHRALVKLSDKTGYSISELMRRAVDQFLDS